MTRTPIGGPSSAILAIALAAVLGGAGPSRADGPADSPGFGVVLVSDAAANDRSGGVVVRVTRGAEGFEVEGRSRVNASSAAAWAVLTDYDGIDRFVSSMEESRVAGRGDGYLLVDQVAVGGFFPFKRRLHAILRVSEEPPGRIRFEDVLRRDFVSYHGEWRIEDHGSSVEIVYRVAARPAFSIPDFVARGMFARTARSLLTEVSAEIARRGRQGASLARVGSLPTAEIDSEP